MTAPGMLQNPSVRKWLGGIEPAWILLVQEHGRGRYHGRSNSGRRGRRGPIIAATTPAIAKRRPPAPNPNLTAVALSRSFARAAHFEVWCI
jgi:hypothetical protein